MNYELDRTTPAAERIALGAIRVIRAALQSDEPASIQQIGKLYGLPAPVAQLTIELLCAQGYMRQCSEGVVVTPLGRAAVDGDGYLKWAEAYDMFFADDTFQSPRPERDGAALAIGSSMIGRRDVYPAVAAAVDRARFADIVDIGAGDASFLAALLGRHPEAHGVALDVSPAACEVATCNIEGWRLADRANVLCADARHAFRLTAPADLVTALFVLHEFRTGDRALESEAMRSIAALVRRGGRLVAAEVAPYNASVHPPFAAAFSLVHAIMGQNLATPTEWAAILAEAGLTVTNTIATEMPAAFVLEAVRE